MFLSVRANEGDAYVLGALPTGTIVHCIEKEPGKINLLYYHNSFIVYMSISIAKLYQCAYFKNKQNNLLTVTIKLL